MLQRGETGGRGAWGGGVPVLLVIYKYIKYAIKIVNSFPLQLLQKLRVQGSPAHPDHPCLLPLGLHAPPSALSNSSIQCLRP